MRRFPIAVLFSVAAALSVAPVVAAGTGDRATGYGVREPSCDQGCPAGSFAFDARSGPHGGNPHGWFTTTFEGFASFTGTVTCLNVHHRWATIFGQISTGTGAADPNTYTQDQEPLYFIVVVHGLGPALPGRPAPDQMSLIGWDTEANFLANENLALADICANPFQALDNNTTMFNLIAGNLRVVDR